MRVGFVLFHYCSFDPSARELQRSELAFNGPGSRTARNRVMLSSMGATCVKAFHFDDGAIIA